MIYLLHEHVAYFWKENIYKNIYNYKNIQKYKENLTYIILPIYLYKKNESQGMPKRGKPI